MPLYTKRKDAGLLKGINRELLHRIVSIELAVYQLNLSASPTNIYGESSKKAYNPPVRITALPSIDPKSTSGENVVDYVQTTRFAMMASDLKEANLVIEAGNIIEFNNRFYEVDNVIDTHYWSGRNPETLFNVTEDKMAEYGYNHSISIECHLTKLSSISIIDVHTATTYEYRHTNKIV